MFVSSAASHIGMAAALLLAKGSMCMTVKRYVLVTGAASGIGKATALLLDSKWLRCVCHRYVRFRT